jgi:hypothetical protein
MMKKEYLECKRVKYLSSLDEDQFFLWLNKINCFDDISFSRDSIKITLASEVDDDCLREITALFYRYKIDMTQLRKLLTEGNRHWFYENKKAYWHRRVFKEM